MLNQITSWIRNRFSLSTPVITHLVEAKSNEEFTKVYSLAEAQALRAEVFDSKITAEWPANTSHPQKGKQ